MRFSLTKKFFLFLIFPLALIYIIELSFTLIEGKKFVQDTFENEMIGAAQNFALDIDSKLEVVESLAKFTANEVDIINNISEEQIYKILKRNLESDSLVYGSALAFVPGKYKGKKLFSPYVFRGKDSIKAIDIGSVSYDYTAPKWDWYNKPIKNRKAVWSEPYFDEGAGNIKMVRLSLLLLWM